VLSFNLIESLGSNRSIEDLLGTEYHISFAQIHKV
jgi:hypothetical protein